MIRQRSSLLRNGAIIASSIFDPGFETDNMGTIMIVTATIFIEKDARVGQMYFHECDEVSEDKLYNGQFQNDKQR
jgi:deoxycytidine triphosphate deaminase